MPFKIPRIDAQFKAIEALFNGEETEPGATIFNVFSNVIDTYHEPQRRPIEFQADIERRTGRFSVPGVIEARGQPIKNPVTGEPHRARVTLPHGFEYHQAEYASSDVLTTESVIPLEWQQPCPLRAAGVDTHGARICLTVRWARRFARRCGPL